MSQFHDKKYELTSPCHIPCWYVKNANGSSKILLYFHGNAEDVGLAKELMEYYSDFWGIHVICIEYPGYGIYSGEPDATRIVQDGINVYDFITTECGWKQENIIIMGRSIGCGPAIQVAAVKNPGALLIVSAFTSIKGAVESLAGKFAKFFVKERFNNKEIIKLVKCPTFILHGKSDRLIPYNHSLELQANYRGKKCETIIQEKMDHNEFDVIQHLGNPVKKFFKNEGIITAKIEGIPDPDFKAELFVQPPNYPGKKKLGFLEKLVRKFI